MPELTYELRGKRRSARRDSAEARPAIGERDRSRVVVAPLAVVRNGKVPISQVEPAATSFDAAYLQRLRSGDDETVKHFDRYFRRLIGAKVWGKFSRQLEQDLVDEVMAAAIENILRGEPRDASRLPAYIFGILANSTKRALRPAKRDIHFVQIDHDRVADGEQTTDRRIEEKEKKKPS